MNVLPNIAGSRVQEINTSFPMNSGTIGQVIIQNVQGFLHSTSLVDVTGISHKESTRKTSDFALRTRETWRF